MTRDASSTLRLILWPSLLTMFISVARLIAEVNGWVTARSGGALSPLGITWCVFAFGGWFAWRLRAVGARPRLRHAWLLALVLMSALAGAVMWQFGPFFRAEASDAVFARLRVAVLILCGIAIGVAAMSFALWPRLAWTLVCYAIPARLTVLLLTWSAKRQGWNTHYTKFGPPGIERADIGETMLSAAIAQIGFWVAFTVVGGVCIGCVVAGARKSART